MLGEEKEFEFLKELEGFELERETAEDSVAWGLGSSADDDDVDSELDDDLDEEEDEEDEY